MGLETIHPDALPRLGKSMDLPLFDRACATLRAAGCGIRAFVLVGAPFVPPDESVAWAVRSAAHAISQGATHVSLIPVRGATPEMQTLRTAGHWTPPTLAHLELALDQSLAQSPPTAVVTADLWDLPHHATCPTCLPARRARLERLNQIWPPRTPHRLRDLHPGLSALPSRRPLRGLLRADRWVGKSALSTDQPLGLSKGPAMPKDPRP